MKKLLTTENITCGYSPKSIILTDLNFKIDKGDFVGLIGPNGAGKSTLLRVLSGFIRPFSGTVKLNEIKISKLTHEQRSRTIAVVPQNIFTPLPFTVAQIVEMGRTSRISRFSPFTIEDRDAVKTSMEKLDVVQFGDHYFNELSGGEKQRVIIAASLAQEPEILLLDEPTSQLDIGHSVHLMNLLTDLNRQNGISILLISHDIQLASIYCRRLVLIKSGTILADGKTEAIIQKELIEKTFNCKIEIVINDQTGKKLIFPQTY